MSYTITLWCGCTVYVSCRPGTTTANAPVPHIEPMFEAGFATRPTNEWSAH